MLNSAKQTLMALAIGSCGGAIFYAVGLPLPWMLGSLIVSAIVAVLGSKSAMPRAVRDVARPVIGVMAGSAFTPAVVASIGDWWPAICLVLLYTMLITALGWAFFSKICGMDNATAFFSSSPGGLNELTLHAASLGGNMRTLVLVHATRIVAVIIVLPVAIQVFSGENLSSAGPPQSLEGEATVVDWLLLAGCGIAGHLVGILVRAPGGIMLPTVLISAIVHASGVTEVAPPTWLVAGVQIIIGSAAGARFAGVTAKELSETVVQSLIWAAILIGASTGIALIGSVLLDVPATALVLALAPGGTAEMTIVAYALGIEVAFVVTCQVSRILFVHVSVPFLFRWFSGPQPPRPEAD